MCHLKHRDTTGTPGGNAATTPALFVWAGDVISLPLELLLTAKHEVIKMFALLMACQYF